VKELRKQIIEGIAEKYKNVSKYLNEKGRRIWASTEAANIGWGGITIVFEATAIDHKTIRKGLAELNVEDKHPERVRKKGGGRKKLKDIDKKLLKDLDFLVAPNTRGDPESPLRWTSKSTYKLAEALRKKGHEISQRSVYNLLIYLGYTLQSNKKTKEGSNHPDRNKQFNYINKRVKAFQKSDCPTISVDTKKKENIGEYKNNGREYNQKGKPEEVSGHDFMDKRLGKVAPYGVYDIGRNKGWVSVGISGDTAAFAVNSIRGWWHAMGKEVYADSRKMLITADCGGSNGYRVRLWKVELQTLANELNIEIYVSHFPPGTSKWNKIEHKMFSYISRNWRGRPLLTRETVVNLIANTRTNKGLEIKSMLDQNKYETGIKVTDEEMARLNLREARFHGEWNYKISPLDNQKN